jgi:hypothetical protein
MNRIVGLIAALALVGLSYEGGRSRNETVVHAAEPSKWAKVETPLHIYHHESRALPNAGVAGAEGFWQAVNQSRQGQTIGISDRG